MGELVSAVPWWAWAPIYLAFELPVWVLLWPFIKPQKAEDGAA